MVEYDKDLILSNESFHNYIRIPDEFDINRRPYASREELLKFSKLAYEEVLTRKDFPVGWELLTTAKNALNDYSGLAAWNTSLGHVVVSHRGTVLGLHPGTVWVDIKGIVLNTSTSHRSSAVTFVEKISNVLREVNKINGNNALQLSLTGHSLGGWLGAITTFTSQYLRFDGQKFVRCLSSGLYPHTVVFDNPGCKETILQIREEHDFRVSPTTLLERLDITVYIIQENPVNMLNNHIGDVHVTLAEGDTFSDVNNSLFSIRRHLLNNFTFQSLHKEYIIDWLKHPGEMDLCGSYWENGRCFTEMPGNFRSYKVFSTEEINFLRILRNLISSTTEMTGEDFCFPDIELFKKLSLNEKTVECCKKEELDNVIKQTKQLVRWYNLKIMSRLEAALIAVPAAFYLHLSQDYLQTVPTLLLDCRDNLGLGDFLDSDTRVLCLQSEDILFDVGRLKNILNQRNQMSLSINLERFELISSKVNVVDLHNNEDFLGKNVLIIDCSIKNILERNLENLEQIIKSCQRGNHTLKIILLYSGEFKLPNIIKDCCLYGVLNNFDLRDLTELSISDIFERKNVFYRDRKFSLSDFLKSSDDLQTVIGGDVKSIMMDDSFNISIDSSAQVNNFTMLPLVSRVEEVVNVSSVIRLVKSNPSIRVVMSKESKLTGELEALQGAISAWGGREVFHQECRRYRDIPLYWFHINPNCSDLILKEMYAPYFYLNRQFHHKMMISLDHMIQNKLSNDVFTLNDFEGDQNSLMNILSLSESSKEMFLKNVVFLMVDNSINTQSYDNIHHLCLETENDKSKLIWKNSCGSLENIRPFLVPDTSQAVGECELISTERRLVIIADEPGMGKSSTLATIYQLVTTEWWPIFLELKSFPEEIINLPRSFDIQSAINFLLVRQPLGDSVERRLLQHCLEGRSPIKLLVLMDGFDEIKYQGASDLGRQRVLEFIRFLILNTTANVIVTTRSFPKDYLENELLVCGTIFKKIDKDVQVDFLQNYWMTHYEILLPTFGEREQKRLCQETDRLYEHCEDVLGGDITQLIGVPLLLRMLANIYLKPIAESWNTDTSFCENRLLFKSTYDLYDKFMENKFSICFNEKMKLSCETRYLKNIKKLIIEDHQSLSFNILNIEDSERYIKTIAPIDHEGWITLIDISRYGIIQLSGGGSYSFIHRTFAEFFFAQFIVQWITKEESYQNISLTELIIHQVLCLPQFSVVRKFINDYLSEFGMSTKALMVMGGKISDTLKSTFNKYVNKNNALHVAIKEDNTHIFGMFVNSSNTSFHQNTEYFSFVSTVNLEVRSPLYLAMIKDNFRELTLKFIDNCSPELRSKYLLASFLRSSGVRPRPFINEYIINEKIIISQSTLSAFQRISELLKTVVDPFVNSIRCGKINDFNKIYKSLKTDDERHYISLALDIHSDTAMNVAAEKGNLDIIKVICNEDVLNLIDGQGRTPLYCAVKESRTEVVRFLLDCKANVECPDTQLRETPLLIATKIGRLDIVRLLVKNNANYNHRDVFNVAPLHIAVENNNTAIVKYLIKVGAYVNVRNRMGSTPLMKAVDKSYIHLVHLLLDANCDITVKNNKDETALDIAENKRYREIAEVLKTERRFHTPPLDKSSLHNIVRSEKKNFESVLKSLLNEQL